MSESNDVTRLQDLLHGISTLDVGAQLLTQVTSMHAPAAMIRGMAEPMPGWIEETRAFLTAGDYDADLGDEEAEDLEMGLFTLSELAASLLEKLDAGGQGQALFALADAMQQTTKEMTATLWKD